MKWSFGVCLGRVFLGCVFGAVFLGLCFWGYVFGAMFLGLCFWGCVFGAMFWELCFWCYGAYPPHLTRMLAGGDDSGPGRKKGTPAKANERRKNNDSSKWCPNAGGRGALFRGGPVTKFASPYRPPFAGRVR